MDEGATHRPIPTPGRSGRRRWVPFWALQVSEVVVALVFVDISIHVHSGRLLIVAAVVFLVLAATADGPLGIARVCSPRLHLVLVVVAAVLIGLAPIIPAVRPDIQGIIVVEFGVVGLMRLATLTTVADAGEGMRLRMHHHSSVIDTTAKVSPFPARSGPAETGGGSGAGGAGGTADPSSSSAADDAARWAGRTAAAAAASGREAAAKYRPEAEAHVKRTIREAGKLAGRLASRWNPPEDRPR
jgi:hypothetical protein